MMRKPGREQPGLDRIAHQENAAERQREAADPDHPLGAEAAFEIAIIAGRRRRFGRGRGLPAALAGHGRLRLRFGRPKASALPSAAAGSSETWSRKSRNTGAACVAGFSTGGGGGAGACGSGSRTGIATGMPTASACGGAGRASKFDSRSSSLRNVASSARSLAAQAADHEQERDQRDQNQEFHGIAREIRRRMVAVRVWTAKWPIVNYSLRIRRDRRRPMRRLIRDRAGTDALHRRQGRARSRATALVMRPLRPSRPSASETRRILGCAVGEKERIARAMLASSRFGIERAGGDEGAGGRAADAGIAMHHDRRRAVPGGDEIDQLADMLLVRRHIAVHHGRRCRPCRAAGGSPPRSIAGGAPWRRPSSASRHGARRSRRRCHAGGRGSRRGSSARFRIDTDIITAPDDGKVSARKLRKPLQIARLGGLGGPGREIIALQGGRKFGRIAEKSPRFRLLEARELRRFEIGRGAVGGLDELLLCGRQFRRQPEADMDGGQAGAVPPPCRNRRSPP